MEKETKKLILGIVLGIILAIIVNVILSSVSPDSSHSTEIRYYKDGELIGGQASERNLCGIGESCEMFGADNYLFGVESDQLTRVTKSDCKDEFEKRIGKQLDGFCELNDVLASNQGITSYYCECWSN